MMRNSLLLSTLNAVEQVQVSFEQTLRTIDEINHRYRIVSDLKSKAQVRQQTFEAEILAAITAPTFTKITNRLKKRKKRKKIKKKTVKEPQTRNIHKETTQEFSVERKYDDKKFICSYDNRESFEEESLDQMELEELDKNWEYNSDNSNETEVKLCSSRSHYCSSCRCTTFYFDVVS